MRSRFGGGVSKDQALEGESEVSYSSSERAEVSSSAAARGGWDRLGRTDVCDSALGDSVRRRFDAVAGVLRVDGSWSSSRSRFDAIEGVLEAWLKERVAEESSMSGLMGED